jgi:CBS domain-containing protein
MSGRQREPRRSKSPLVGVSVADVMHPGLISCPPETPLRAVARMLASYRVHAVVVFPRHMGDVDHALAWSVVSDLDVARAAREGSFDAQTAGAAAASAVRTIDAAAPLADAVAAMVADGVSHVIAIEPTSGRPVGMLSTLDIARALAGLP